MQDVLPFKLFKATLPTLWHSDAVGDYIHQIRTPAAFTIWRIRHNNWDLLPTSIRGAIDVGIDLTEIR